jgi:hypothetical protein
VRRVDYNTTGVAIFWRRGADHVTLAADNTTDEGAEQNGLRDFGRATDKMDRLLKSSLVDATHFDLYMGRVIDRLRRDARCLSKIAGFRDADDVEMRVRHAENVSFDMAGE